MNIKRLLILILPLLTIFFPLQVVQAATVANTYQITTDGSQQTAPYVDRNMVVYTSLSNIWGYNFDTDTNVPVLERAGQQFTTHFFKNLVIYEDTPDSEPAPDVRMYNIKTGKDTLVASGPGAQTSGVTNGKVVAYIDGGACGSLKVYNIRKKTTQQIVNSTCHPVRISGDIIVYPVADPGGTNIAGYDLDESQAFDIVTDTDFQEVPNIFGDNVVWLHRTTGALGNPNSIRMKNLETGEVETIYESSTTTLNWPAVSNKYVVWSESSATHVGGIQGANLRTGEVFEVQAQGSHQNSHTMPSIWRNIATWMSFRTGNGDIYGSEFTKPLPSQVLLNDNFTGPSLNSNSWEFFSTNGGNYIFDNGSIVVPGGTSMFYIRSKNNPFPTSGPFTVGFGIQYTSVDESGVGVALGFEQQNGYDPSNVPVAYWQGSNFGLQLVRFGLTEAVIGGNPDLNYHVGKIVYDGDKYQVFLDGVLKYTSPSSATAKSLWFGNPFCCRSNWTGFKLDYIKVTQP